MCNLAAGERKRENGAVSFSGRADNQHQRPPLGEFKKKKKAIFYLFTYAWFRAKRAVRDGAMNLFFSVDVQSV